MTLTENFEMALAFGLPTNLPLWCAYTPDCAGNGCAFDLRYNRGVPSEFTPSYYLKTAFDGYGDGLHVGGGTGNESSEYEARFMVSVGCGMPSYGSPGGNDMHSYDTIR